MRFKPAVLMAGLAAVIAAAPASAHHGFAVEFDASKCMDVAGTLTAIDWQNPHAYFHMDIKGADGKTESWTFEMLSVVAMRRAGTDKQDFLDNIGKPITARVCPSKNGSPNRGAAESLKLPDGRVRVVGQYVEGGRPGGGGPPAEAGAGVAR
jgi:hypothetical protein